MKIAIVGAGFTGLSAAFELLEKGHEVVIFEKDSNPGGLAIGFKEKVWHWSLEKHYHHWFSNDDKVINLAKKINYEILKKRPKTSIYVEGKIYQLDSPLHVLSFPRLPLTDRVRMAAVLGFLKLDPFWKPLEKLKAEDFLLKTMRKNAYK